MDDRTELRHRAVALRRQGMSRRQISAELGVPDTTLGEWLRGVPPPEWTKRPRAKDDARAKAKDLRKAGRTYDEIAAELGVSKSSCSLWLRDIPGPPSDPERRSRLMNDARWNEHRRRVKIERQQTKFTAARQVGDLSDRELFLAGVALYWAEGSKDKPSNPHRHERMEFINSDPSVIEVYLAWLDLLGVRREDLVFRLSIHESADVAAAERFWRNLVDAPTSQFRRASLKRHNPKTVRTNVGPGYRGCLVIHVRNSRRLYQQVEGWWFGLTMSAEAGSRRLTAL